MNLREVFDQIESVVIREVFADAEEGTTMREVVVTYWDRGKLGQATFYAVERRDGSLSVERMRGR